jgi:hypothetical protein
MSALRFLCFNGIFTMRIVIVFYLIASTVIHPYFSRSKFLNSPVTVAEPSKAGTVFARSEAGIVGSKPTQGMDVWFLCMCVFLCLCTGRERPCDELITRPRNPTDCLKI